MVPNGATGARGQAQPFGSALRWRSGAGATLLPKRSLVANGTPFAPRLGGEARGRETASTSGYCRIEEALYFEVKRSAPECFR